MSVTKTQVAALYAAVFNRAPDQSGLEYWVANAESFDNMALGFVAHPVFEKTYGELSNEDFVKAIYENVLQGAGDDEGVSFWVGALDGGLGRAEFLASFLDAALNYDGDDVDALARKAALDNQVEVGLYFTETMGEKSNLDPNTDVGSLDIEDDAAYQAAQAAIADVTADPASVEAAKAAIDEAADEDGAEEAIIEALEAYQAALDAEAAAVKAEEAVIKAAADKVDGLGAESSAKDAADAVEAAVDSAADEVVTASDKTITGELSDTKITNAEKVLQAKVDAAKAAVAEEAANAPTVVALQQQLLASKDAVEAVNAVNLQFKGEQAKFEALNKDFTVTIESAVAGTAAIPADPDDVGGVETPATPATPLHATITDEADANFVVAVVGGKAVVYSGTAQSWKDGVPQAGDKALKTATEKDLENFKDLDALLATIVAVKGNETTVKNANKAIEKAVVDALAADGYKLFDAKGKEIQWSKATFAKDGTLDLAEGVEIAKSFKDGEAVDPLTGAFYTPLAANGVEGIAANDNVTEDGAADLGEAFDDTAIKTAAGDSAKAVGALKGAEKALKDFQADVKTYNELKAIQTELADAAKAVEDAGTAVADAEKAFEELGANLVKVEGGEAEGAAYNEDDEDQLVDLFVYSGDALKVTGFDGEDAFYFGDKAAALVVADAANLAADKQLGGDANVLEIFAVQDGANTDLYVEKAAFAGNSSNKVDGSNADFVKVTLVGVNAEDLQFNDGFLTFA